MHLAQLVPEREEEQSGQVLSLTRKACFFSFDLIIVPFLRPDSCLSYWNFSRAGWIPYTCRFFRQSPPTWWKANLPAAADSIPSILYLGPPPKNVCEFAHKESCYIAQTNNDPGTPMQPYTDGANVLDLSGRFFHTNQPRRSAVGVCALAIRMRISERT